MLFRSLAAIPELQPRAKTVLDLIDLAQFIYAERPLPIDEKAALLLTEDGIGHLATLEKSFAALDEWTVETLDATVRTYAENVGLKLGKVAQPLRAALTGRTVSPGIFEVMVLIGREESLSRLADVSRNTIHA